MGWRPVAPRGKERVDENRHRKRNRVEGKPASEGHIRTAPVADQPAGAPRTATATSTATSTTKSGTYFEKVRTFASQHPAGVVVAAAGAGVLFAAELTVGALDGIGASRLFRKKSAPDVRAELRRQREDLLGQTKPQRERLMQHGHRLLQQGQQLKQKGEHLVERGKALWPFPRRPAKPTA